MVYQLSSQHVTLVTCPAPASRFRSTVFGAARPAVAQPAALVAPPAEPALAAVLAEAKRIGVGYSLVVERPLPRQHSWLPAAGSGRSCAPNAQWPVVGLSRVADWGF